MKYKDRKHIKEPKRKRKKVKIRKEDLRIKRCKICSNPIQTDKFQDYCKSCIEKFPDKNLCYYCKKIFPSYLEFNKHNCDTRRESLEGDINEDMIKQGIKTFLGTLTEAEQEKITNGVKTGKEVDISKTIELPEEE